MATKSHLVRASDAYSDHTNPGRIFPSYV